MSSTKTLAKGTAWGLFAAFLLKFLGWFYWIVLARMVPKEEIGVYSAVLSLMAVVILFSDLGLGSGSVGRYVPAFCGKGLYNHARKVLRVSLIVGVFSSFVFMLLLFLLSGAIEDFYHNPRVVPVLGIMLFYILFYNLYMIASSFLNGRKMIKLFSYSSSLQGFLKLFFTVFLVLALGSVAESLALGLVLSYLFASVAAWFWALQEDARMPKSGDDIAGTKLLSEMVPFGLTIVVLTSMYIINSQFDSIMLGHLLPPEINMEMVAVYALLASFATVTNIFANSIGVIFHPMVNELWAQGNTDEMRKVSGNYFRWIALLTTPVMVVIAAFSFELLSVLYGQAYSIGSFAFILYSLGLFTYSFSYPVQNTLSGMRRLDITVKVVLSGVVLNVVLNLLLIPVYGINGSAFASMVSFTLMTLLFLSIRKKTFLHIPSEVYKPLLAGLASLGIVLAAKYTASGFGFEGLGGYMKAGFLLSVVSFTGAAYLFFLVLLKAFNSEDEEILSAAMRRMKMPEALISFVVRTLFR